MLKTASDFENSIKFIMSGLTDEMNENLKYQIRTFDSEDFNSTFDVIESRLNNLYEKTRVMEDVIKYIKEYLEQAIYSSTKECRSILNSIEDNRDKLKTNTYISYDVTFLEGNGSYIDRDNTVLPHCSINNNTVTLSGKVFSDIPIKLIERKKGFTPYKSSLDELKEGRVYRVFYYMDGQVNGGLKEDIYIELSKPSVINFIDIIPSNCEIENVRYINEIGGIEYDTNFKNIISKERKVKAIQFTLSSKLYKSSVYYIDQSRMATDFWDRVRDGEYSTAIGITNISDLDQLAGLDSFKQAYKAYVAAVESWRQRRAVVAEINRQNGYSDYVPNYDMIIGPSILDQPLPVNRSHYNADPYPSIEQDIRYQEGGK